MLILAGKPLGYRFAVLDSDMSAPAAALADHFVPGDLYDPRALSDLCAWADITTFEIEHANTEVLTDLERKGARLAPSPQLLSLINDKLEQKRTLAAAGIPVPGFWTEHPGRYPIVQKLRHGGYDGRGVTILDGPEDPELDGLSYYEEKISLKAELAALVARRPTGQIVAFPPVDMEFHPDANIVRRVVVPARVSQDVADQAIDIAIGAVEALGGVGLHAVELFWTEDNDPSGSRELLVNEIAPRPHNSGHLTIEACETSQYEQHLRAICDLPLGSTRLRYPAVSLNLLGAPDADGRPDLAPLRELMGHDRVHVHWYGKAQVRPFRKMGHVTMTGDDLAGVVSAADALDRLMWIGGMTP